MRFSLRTLLLCCFCVCLACGSYSFGYWSGRRDASDHLGIRVLQAHGPVGSSRLWPGLYLMLYTTDVSGQKRYGDHVAVVEKRKDANVWHLYYPGEPDIEY